MHGRCTSQWQSRRKISLGPPVRRAHPASGATWNVQVVRGKMTTRCLWNACRALVLGMALMTLGAGMATIGYYAEHLSIAQEIRGNATVRVKNESRGFHLNNFSYVGPIVMGFGGFIVVAACVMTFEARDSAAKVVPARFKLSTNSRSSNQRTSNSSRRTTGGWYKASAVSTCQAVQTNRWDNHLGVFRTSPSETVPDRKELTAALVHFSRALGSPGKSTPSNSERRVSRSGSVPNLTTIASARPSVHSQAVSPILKPNTRHRSTRNSSLIHKTTREKSGPYLHPGMLQHHRHALSVDEAGPYYQKFKETLGVDSHAHGESSRPRDRTKRSDTARRHVLSRQKPIEKDEPHSPDHRKLSTPTDITNMFRRGSRCLSTASTKTMESKDCQTDQCSPDNRLSPRSPKSPKHGMVYQLSTPSIERELKSQLSICSEPVASIRLLSCQSSLEPCLPEESPDQEDIDLQQLQNGIGSGSSNSGSAMVTVHSSFESPTALHLKPSTPKRPDTLILNCNHNDNKTDKHKYLYRSNSSRTFKRSKPKMSHSGYEFDQIYFISSNKDDEHYDSIDVIDERRRKNFNKFDSSDVNRRSSVIYSEYCSMEQQQSSENKNGNNDNKSEICQQETEMGGAGDSSTTVTTTADNEPRMGASIESKTDDGNNERHTDMELTTIVVQADIEGCAAAGTRDLERG